MPQQEITEKSRKYKETHMKWSDRRFVPSDLSNLRCDRESETVDSLGRSKYITVTLRTIKNGAHTQTIVAAVHIHIHHIHVVHKTCNSCKTSTGILF